MFDVGFSEIILVCIVGLVVLGPERLPIAIKTVFGWITTLRQLASTVQRELAQELKLQELQESMDKMEKSLQQKLDPNLHALQNELDALRTKTQEIEASLHAKSPLSTSSGTPITDATHSTPAHDKPTNEH